MLAVGLALSVALLSEDPAAGWPSVHAVPAPDAAQAPVASQGVLGRDTVRRYVQLHRPAIRHCYQMELGQAPGLTTTVRVTFTVGPDGRVSSVEEPGPGPLARCVGESVRRIRFPALHDTLADGTTRPSQSSTAVTYRFAFRPARKAAQRARASQPPVAGQPAEPMAMGPRAPAPPSPGPASAPSTTAASQAQAQPPAPPGRAPAPGRPPAPRPGKPRRGPNRCIDIRHGDDPLRGIPAGDAL